VRFSLSPKTGSLAPLSANSDPIVVVSKQQQIRNKEAEVTREKDPALNPKTKKRVRQEDVFEVLNEIANLQRATYSQNLQIAEMMATKGAGSAPSFPITIKSEVLALSKVPQLSVDQALAALADAYRRDALSSGLQRPTKIRRFLESQDVSTQSELKEIGFALTLAEFPSHSELNFHSDQSSSPLEHADSYNTEMAMAPEPAAPEFEQHWTPLGDYGQDV